MPPRHHLHFLAYASVLAGTARMLMSFIPWTPENLALEAIAALIDLGFLFGLLGLYLSLADRDQRAFGIVETVGFFLAAAGVASIVGPDATAFGVNFYTVGAGISLLGLALLSVIFLRRHTGPRVAAGAWLGAFVLAFGVPFLPALFIPVGFLFGTG